MGLDMYMFKLKSLSDEALKDAYNIPESFRFEGYYGGNGLVTVYFRGNDSQPITVHLEEEDMKRFRNSEEDQAYLFGMANGHAGYWRKEYGLQDLIYQSFDRNGTTVENCGVYVLSEEQIYEIANYIEENGLAPFDMELKESEFLVYHEPSDRSNHQRNC